jgi:hypothetical protein
MAPTFRPPYLSDDFASLYEDLGIRPQLGHGKESPAKTRPTRVLSRIKFLARQHAATDTRRHRAPGRGASTRARGRYLRKVVIKARVVRNKGKNKRLLLKHIMYLQREGVGIGGTPAEPFTQGHSVGP